MHRFAVMVRDSFGSWVMTFVVRASSQEAAMAEVKERRVRPFPRTWSLEVYRGQAQ